MAKQAGDAERQLERLRAGQRLLRRAEQQPRQDLVGREARLRSEPDAGVGQAAVHVDAPVNIVFLALQADADGGIQSGGAVERDFSAGQLERLAQQVQAAADLANGPGQHRSGHVARRAKLQIPFRFQPAAANEHGPVRAHGEIEHEPAPGDRLGLLRGMRQANTVELDRVGGRHLGQPDLRLVNRKLPPEDEIAPGSLQPAGTAHPRGDVVALEQRRLLHVQVGLDRRVRAPAQHSVDRDPALTAVRCAAVQRDSGGVRHGGRHLHVDEREPGIDVVVAAARQLGVPGQARLINGPSDPNLEVDVTLHHVRRWRQQLPEAGHRAAPGQGSVDGILPEGAGQAVVADAHRERQPRLGRLAEAAPKHGLQIQAGTVPVAGELCRQRLLRLDAREEDVAGARLDLRPGTLAAGVEGRLDVERPPPPPEPLSGAPAASGGRGYR